MSYAISANRLSDGVVVYFSTDQQWTTHISRALTVHTQQEAQQLLKTAETIHTAIGAYSISLEETDNTPTLYREIIRTKGPSVRTDLGLQSEDNTHNKSSQGQ